MPPISVYPVTPDCWLPLTELFERPGPRSGVPFTAGCWCQYWHVRGRAYDDGWGAEHRSRLEQQVHQGPPPGLLADLAGEPVGWCRLGPRESFERLAASLTLRSWDDDGDRDGIWSLVCLSVHIGARRRGVAGSLLAAAVDYAAQQGADVLEAYPVREGHHVIDSFTGYLPMFVAAGFEPMRHAGRRTVVRRRL